MPASPNRIVVVGSSNTDMIVQVPRIPTAGQTVLGGRFSMAAGGKGANQAVAARLAGGHVALVACLGTDTFGDGAMRRLVQHGIDVEFIVRNGEAPSGLALILVGPDGQSSIAVAPGANAKLSVA